MANLGYMKYWRQTLDNPVAMKDAVHLAIWTWLLLKANWEETQCKFGKQVIKLQPGQLPPISRRTISEQLNVTESSVQRTLKEFEDEQMIEQQTFSKYRLITILAWDKYQKREHQSEQQNLVFRTGNEPQVNTKVNTTIRSNKNIRNKETINNNKKPWTLEEKVKAYWAAEEEAWRGEE